MLRFNVTVDVPAMDYKSETALTISISASAVIQFNVRPHIGLSSYIKTRNSRHSDLLTDTEIDIY